MNRNREKTMYWIKDIQNAICFVEENLQNALSVEEIAARANSSNANFQRIFSIVTGMPVGEYIRCRRLSLAGEELAGAGAKVIDVAAKYGYETAESFTKAFTRFHGVTPTGAKKAGDGLKHFAALSLQIDIRAALICGVKSLPVSRRSITMAVKWIMSSISWRQHLISREKKQIRPSLPRTAAWATAFAGQTGNGCGAANAWVH
ncbi:MAG: AraC family transcriptional regulator [Clostridia bacterium]|nr:AraC family transcriptional regulator [Clostridia bacterium]